MIYKQFLKISESERQEINGLLSKYSENGELKKEFGIEEDATLRVYPIQFRNGFTAYLLLKSGQNNCWLECNLMTCLGFSTDKSVVIEDLRYTDGTDAMHGMDDIVIEYDKNIYRIGIAPESRQDVLDFRKYLRETLSDFDYKTYVKYTEESISITGDIEEIEKAKKILAEHNIDIFVNDSIEHEWCIKILKEQLDMNGVFKTREELEKLATEFINTNCVWENFDSELDKWINSHIK